MVQRASTDVEDGIEKLVEEAIKEGLEEMLGSRLAEAFYTTLNNFVKVLRGYPSLLTKPELVISFLRQNFKEAFAEVRRVDRRAPQRERLKEMRVIKYDERGDLLSLLRGLTTLTKQTMKGARTKGGREEA